MNALLHSRNGMLRFLRFLPTAVSWLLVACGAIPFAFFYCTTPTRWFNVRATELITWRNTLILAYEFGNGTTGRTTPLLSGGVSFILLWQWCGTLAVALGSVGLLWIAAAKQQMPHPSAQLSTSPPKSTRIRSLGAAMRKAVRRLGRLLHLRVPPGGLWRALLGLDGLSLGDLLLVALWFGLHIMWMYEMTQRVLDNRRTNPPPPKPIVRPPPMAAKISAPLPLAANGSTSPPRSVTRHLLQSAPAANTNNTNLTTPSTASAKPPPAKALPPPPPAKQLRRLPYVVQDSVAKYFGWVGRLDILLLFFPLARCNFLHWLLGSDFPTLVKYHRWLGHGTILVYSLHGITYMGIWHRDHVVTLMLNWGMNAGVNRLSGLISMCGGWLLWITALSPVRRRLFNLFYVAHIFGAVVFMLFAFMHRKDVATWVMPGVFLYLLDVVLRTIQQNFNATTVSAAAGPSSPSFARVSPGGGVLTLSLKCEKGLEWIGGDIVFLNLPAVSWWQWHPFTLASSSKASGPDSERRMVLHTKKYNRWTQRLVSRLANDDTPLKLYVSGPYNSANRRWINRFDRHVFIAGGIGVTPVLGMLQELLAARSASATLPTLTPSASPTRPVTLVWISRSIDELQLLPHELIQAAGKSGWLDLQLYLTGSGPALQIVGSANKLSPSPSFEEGSTTSTSGEAGAKGTVLNVTPPLLASCDSGSSGKDAITVSSRPLTHSYMYHPALWAAALLLCFGGGFLGLIVAQSYDAQRSRTVLLRQDFSYVGLLQFAALGLCSMVPPGLFMCIVHLVVSRRGLHRSQSDSKVLPGQPTVEATLESNAQAIVDASSLNLFVTNGRPDLHELMSRLARASENSITEADSEELRVGVFVAGPAAMVGAVHDAAAKVNGVWGRRGAAYLELTTMTHEL